MQTIQSKIEKEPPPRPCKGFNMRQNRRQQKSVYGSFWGLHQKVFEHKDMMFHSFSNEEIDERHHMCMNQQMCATRLNHKMGNQMGRSIYQWMAEAFFDILDIHFCSDCSAAQERLGRMMGTGPHDPSCKAQPAGHPTWSPAAGSPGECGAS